MWYLLVFGLRIVRGDTMSDQVKPRITGPALEPVAAIVEPRTIHDVEADLALAGLEISHHRSRRGDTVNNAERLAERPALLVHELNWLLEEWQALNANA